MFNIRLRKTDLLKELALVQSVVERRHTIPILSHVLLDAAEGNLAITATDLDVTLTTSCSADTESPGGVALQARKLLDIVRNLPDAEIHFKADDSNRVSLTCDRSRFRLSGLARENFPETPKSIATGLKCSSGLFRDFVQRTIFATTQEESRYALAGVQFEVIPATGKIRMVATDGHRLALIETEKRETDDSTGRPDIAEGRVDDRPDGGGSSEGINLLIPKKALAELIKLGDDADDDIEMAKDENHIYFRVGKRHLSSRILAGQFPNYEMVLPKDNPRVALVSAEAFAAAVRRVAIVSDERSHAVRLQVSPSRFDLSSMRAEEGEQAEEDVLVKYEGDEFDIGFNSNYLLDFFSVVTSGEIRMEFKDSRGPVLVRPLEDRYDYRYVVMPLRL